MVRVMKREGLFSYSVVYRSYVARWCTTIVGMFHDGETACLLSIGEELRFVLEANADGWNGTAPFGIPRQRTSMNERKSEKKENNVPDTCANRNRFRGREEDEARARAERTRSREIREPVSRLLGSGRKERYEAKSIIRTISPERSIGPAR